VRILKDLRVNIIRKATMVFNRSTHSWAGHLKLDKKSGKEVPALNVILYSSYPIPEVS